MVDFTDTPEQAAFRAEVRAFIEESAAEAEQGGGAARNRRGLLDHRRRHPGDPAQHHRDAGTGAAARVRQTGRTGG